MRSPPPALAARPTYDPASTLILFQFWKDGVKQAASIEISGVDGPAAVDYFMAHWDRIGPMAEKIPPKNGEVKMKLKVFTR